MLKRSFASLPASADPSDWVLVQSTAAGDALAFTAIYQRHHFEVRGLARRILADAALAEDVVQEVFEALPKALRGYRNECSLSVFIASIAVRKSRSHIRASIRRRRQIHQLSLYTEGAYFDGEAAAERGRHVQELVAALDQLPVLQRLAFVLCEVQEMPSPQAAQVMKVPPETVRTRLHHAKLKLRELLGGHG